MPRCFNILIARIEKWKLTEIVVDEVPADIRVVAICRRFALGWIRYLVTGCDLSAAAPRHTELKSRDQPVEVGRERRKNMRPQVEN